MKFYAKFLCDFTEDELSIQKRRDFYSDVMLSMETRAVVYSTLDEHGITYNNCSTLVHPSDFPAEVKPFLCTEGARKALERKRPWRNRTRTVCHHRKDFVVVRV